MFLGAAAGQGPLKNVPRFETRRALLVINLQNDSLDKHGDLYITQPQDFVQRIKDVIPYFRKLGDVVWIRTEFDPPVTIKRTSATHDDNEHAGDAHATTEQTAAQHSVVARTEETSDTKSDAPKLVVAPVTYHPTSRAKADMSRASAHTRSNKRRENLDAFTNEETASSDIEDYLSKPRKGQQPKMYQPGTFGAAIATEVLPLVDEKTDLVIVKNHYSAFDTTHLLLSLRMKLVTDVYLCGCLSNVSIYATAADAVRHGLNVTVVEDCIGYRSEAKHESAMRHMGDVLGVSGIDSEEIMEQSGGRVPPDADPSMITGPGADGIALGALSLASSPKIAVVVEEQSDEKNVSVTVSTVATVDVPQTLSDGMPGGNGKPDAGKDLDLPPITGQSISGIDTSSGMLSSSHKDPTPPPAVQLDLPENILISDPLPPTKIQARVPSVVAQILGPGDHIGDGDSSIVHNFLEPSLATDAFVSLKSEVEWQKMHHRSGEVPRLVAVQGEVGEDGSIPIYRHPADESPPLCPFSATLKDIKDVLESRLQQSFNHALIQLYREGKDNISEHSDKTLDIIRNSKIVNLSLGAQRTMTLRMKKSSEGPDRQVQRIPMPHDSLFILGPQTNTGWLHGIRADKRPTQEKSDDENDYGGERISITFRNIGTFMDQASDLIWGQGARAKGRLSAGRIRKGDSEEAKSMVIAFGKENQLCDFDWDAEYGQGFDTINLILEKNKIAPVDDKVANI